MPRPYLPIAVFSRQSITGVRCRVRRAALAALAAALMLTGPVASTGKAPDGPDDEVMAVPGGTARLLRAANIVARVDTPRAWVLLARVLHGGAPVRTPVTVAALEPLLADVAAGGGSASDQVPALLPHAVWEEAVFARRVEPAQLAFAILRDRRAALLYTGLFSLDPDTLAYFAAHPPLLASIYSGPAGPFAAFAENLTVRGSQVVLPGGAAAAPDWERLVGAPAAEPERFIPALLGRDAGRLAWLFDTLASLDEAHRRFVLRAGLPRLYDVFGLEPWRSDFANRPLTRAPIDFTILFRMIGVTSDGALAPPDDQRLWDRVFNGANLAGPPSPATSDWILRAMTTPSTRERQLRLETLLFAQRVFGPQAGAAQGYQKRDLMAQALSAYGGHAALMLTLEHLGVTDPADFVAAVRAADLLASGLDRYRAALRAVTFQGALAVVTRVYDAGTIDDRTARTLALALVRLPATESPAYVELVVRWIESALLPALPGAGSDPEQRLLDGLAGIRTGRSLPVIQWEGQDYRVDVAAGERLRMGRIRERQGGNDLTTVLRLRQLRASGDASFASTLPAVVARLGLHDTRLPFSTETPSVAASASRTRGGAKAGTRLDQAGTWVEVLLAELLASYAYAAAIGDPDAPMLLAGNPARTHDVDVDGSTTWLLARSVYAGSQLILRGSLLGLERALAVPSLRQAKLDAPAVAPNLGQKEAEGLAESVAVLNPFRLEDRSRDALAAALRRGRERIAAAARDRREIDTLAEQAGIERWRRRLMRLASGRDAGAVLSYWSLGEVCAVGQIDAAAVDVRGWGVSQRFLDGTWRSALPVRLSMHDLGGRLGVGLLSARVADLHLRVAEWLAEMKLPAALAQGVLRAAAWDLATDSLMADIDDWLAVARIAQALSAERLGDHVSALTADGPLVPVVLTP